MIYYKLKIKPQRKPDFICIGAPKAGTTWLWRVLNDHPDVSLPHPKELRFFAYRDYGPNMPFTSLKRLVNMLHKLPAGESRDLLIQASINELKCRFGDLEDYLEIFGRLPKDHLVGEVSPQYALLSDPFVKDMYEMNKKLKLLFLIRDPVERSISNAKMKLNEKTVELNDENIFKIAISQVQKNLSSYDIIIEKYLRVFPCKNLKIFYYDDIKSNPFNLLKEICCYLGLKYKDKYFLSTAQKPAFEGPKVNLETDLYKKIYKHYANIYKRLSKLFGDKVAVWEQKYKIL